ncbi:MAG: phosphoadenosine phosphosulfate reductase family protein, partial [Nitrososphaerales archaeon]
MAFTFLSFGAGVQTTALLLTDEFDEIIFADTGAEMPETYDYIEKYVKPYCKEKDLKFTTVTKMRRFVWK